MKLLNIGRMLNHDDFVYVGLRIHFWPQISIADQTFKNRSNVESWCVCIKFGSESISDLKSPLQIKLSKIGRMLNHDDFALDCAQNPFLKLNLDRRSKFQKSAERQIMMIMPWVGLRIHFWPQISIADQTFKNRVNVESWFFALGWAQNPFLISNFDRRSNFQKSAECWFMMILY